jgi:hypothetical protein
MENQWPRYPDCIVMIVLPIDLFVREQHPQVIQIEIINASPFLAILAYLVQQQQMLLDRLALFTINIYK